MNSLFLKLYRNKRCLPEDERRYNQLSTQGIKSMLHICLYSLLITKLLIEGNILNPKVRWIAYLGGVMMVGSGNVVRLSIRGNEVVMELDKKYEKLGYEGFQQYSLEQRKGCKGFTIPNCSYFFQLDSRGGWFDQHGQYFNSQARPSSPPSSDEEFVEQMQVERPSIAIDLYIKSQVARINTYLKEEPVRMSIFFQPPLTQKHPLFTCSLPASTLHLLISQDLAEEILLLEGSRIGPSSIHCEVYPEGMELYEVKSEMEKEKVQKKLQKLGYEFEGMEGGKGVVWVFCNQKIEEDWAISCRCISPQFA